MKNKLSIITICLSFSLAVGAVSGFVYKSQTEPTDHSYSMKAISDNLEEEMWSVQLIVKGTVIDQGPTFKRDAGLSEKSNFSYDTTPSTVRVDEVLFGDVSSDNITFLQHGSLSDTLEKERFVKEREDVILLLTKTTDGKYWSYNFEAGLWRIKDGKVKSKTESEVLKGLNNLDIKDFKNKISSATKNKKRNPLYKK